MSKKEVRHLEESRNDLAERYQEQKARAERLAAETSRLSARVKVLEEALEGAKRFMIDELGAEDDEWPLKPVLVALSTRAGEGA